MFGPKGGGDPHDGGGIGAGRIGQDLPEVQVVGRFELVLDDYYLSGCLVATHQLKAEPAYRMLGNL